MHVEGTLPDAATVVTILSVCGQCHGLQKTIAIHAIISYSSLEGDHMIETALVNTYSMCGELEMARRSFRDMNIKSLVSWTSIIAAHVRHGLGRDAIMLFSEMQMSSVIPNDVTYTTVISALRLSGLCIDCNLVYYCIVGIYESIHLQMGNALITAYSKCGSLDDAISIFCRIALRDIVSWTSIMAAYVRYGFFQCTLQHNEQMWLEGFLPDRITFISMIDACAGNAALMEGKKLHMQIESFNLNLDVVLGTALIDMYGKCGKQQIAERVFDQMPVRNSLTWNSIVTAHAQNGDIKQAFAYFTRMENNGVQPDIATFSSILSACAHAGLVEEGFKCALAMQQTYGIHPTVEHYNCLIGLLGRLGLVKDGKCLMGNIPVQPTASSWAALLGACKEHVDLQEGELVAEHAFETCPERQSLSIVLSELRLAAVSSIGMSV
ncbi:hypothetical protein KP509_18G033000 [Ceratopteris richardii]|nr:hypothetical protein KP509_18G033000 [Ceratopteris richardii]